MPIKTAILGNGAVGKTTFIRALTDSWVGPETIRMTPGIDIQTVHCRSNKKLVTVVWDLGGQEQFRFMIPSFIRGASIVILMYAVNYMPSFFQIDDWMTMVKQYSIPQYQFLIANKIDYENRCISSEEGMEYAKFHGFRYYEISAKTGKGIEQFYVDFEKILKELNEKTPLLKTSSSPSNIQETSSITTTY